MSALLTARGIGHRYQGVLALNDIELDVPKGTFMAILGPNGAGKSTLAQILAGAIRPAKGQILLEGTDVTARAGRQGLIRNGVALIPEGRRLFGQLTVDENLMLGAYGQPRAVREARLEKVYALMPEAVRQGKHRAAITLSGGEQQMLVVGRALMAEPRAILIDEPSLGLAPILTAKVYDLLSGLRRGGVTVVVFEQLATHALRHADSIVVINQGEISFRGTVDDEATHEALRTGYLGH
ncbi:MULTISPECIES: ATP-binding cassette domain-containing protein [unclassified Chelatococcus]|jgi:branched-chain amino acid transport system ATP-binding protein|uniref:ABC transporter ATP-binding protein n=1 Tax=unclassified Chelatococcus TaxID=2638111 RepID=UPI001BCD8256|nr:MULTISPECIES: ATP-binding cassette domain-containing protein [unclassified Chelatococcus]MBS7742685.1 ATP-binding cassette domain-containing protein [Chelatococcus sp. HY11]MBX3542197.1 ATP-binding cassette domain-containing protein [Chelatococcus sp.]MCO5075586.1 ATP-binding cassette domain-containing protein [Chelatococcus sp.]CAH1695294.1 High-affinity branched-chain amino acid transport ATP-binding protein LivF [Hyphomicrobiales bacterium]